MKQNVVWILGLCLLALACQKRKYPEEKIQLDKEDIYFNGYFGSEPINLKIGTDGYYCYASYKQRVDSVYVFEGELRKYNCNPCTSALRVELSDYQPRLPGASVPPDLALKTGSRNFIPGLPWANSFRFVAHANKAVSSFRWELSDGYSSQDSIMSCDFAQPGPQTISLTVRTKENCESVVINKIFIGGRNGVFACSVLAEPLQNNNSKFSSQIIGGIPPFRYTWNFGDGYTSALSSPTHDYNWSGSYPVKLRIEDAENHVCESNYIHVAGNDQSSCTANISLSRTGRKNVSLNGVKIQWTDESSVTLRSDSIKQPAESYFDVIASQPYASNEKGEPGRLLTLRFNVLVSDGNRKVWLKSESAAIAVTYK